MSSFGTGFLTMARGAYGRVPGTQRVADAADERRRSASYWIVCVSERRPPNPEELLCVMGEPEGFSGEDRYGEGDRGSRGYSRALAVFSFREEAEDFFRLRGGRQWLRVREFAAGELISLLYGLWGGFTGVALDPMPEVEHWAAEGLVIVDRGEFVKLLVRRVNRLSPAPVR